MEIGTQFLIGGGVGLLIGGILFFIFHSRSRGGLAFDETTMTTITQRVLKDAQEQFLTLAQERLGREQTSAQQDFAHKKEHIEQMIAEIRKDLTENNRRMKESDDARIGSFSAIKQELEMSRQVVHELRGSTDDLKKILSNNQMRGAFGEQVAENLLKMAGFVIGQDYVFNQEQEATDTRPDFTLFLPDKTRMNIDVKFPFSALMKMTSTDDPVEREQHKKQFAIDVKQKVKQVSSRDYINPEEKTVDFVILFIPNEMIFSFVYDQLHEVWEEAMMKKVIFAGPFSFTALLRMVKQAYSNFRYQENLHQVIGLIQKFESEYEKYSESVTTLGDRIQSAQKQFEVVSGTRSRALSKVLDQIKNQNVLPVGSEEEA